jgi:predicted dehydrogenase
VNSHGGPLVGAVIGCGFVSRHHLEGWSRVPGALIVAICDLDAERLERAGKFCPHARRYRSAARLFADELTLDFVEICTGADSHPVLVALAAARGVHILCQKPAANDRADFEAMIAACDRAGVRLMIHENWRFRPWYRAMKTRIEAGVIGMPIHLRIAHRDTRALRADGYQEQPYLAKAERLILMDMGCHLVDTARYLFGEIVSVTATIGRFGRYGVGEDVAMLAVRFKNGALGSLDMSWCANPERARPEWALNETVAEGSKGSERLLPDGSLELTSLAGTRTVDPVDLPPPERVYVDGYAATQRHFIEGLLAGRPHETRASESLETMNVVWAAYQSAEEGRTVSLDGD